MIQLVNVPAPPVAGDRAGIDPPPYKTTPAAPGFQPDSSGAVS